jgi:hypothetical protein
MKNWFKNLFGLVPTQPIDEKEKSEIKKLLKTVFNMLKKHQENKADDKITGAEWLGLAKTAYPLINSAKNYQAIKAEILKFKTDDGIELAQWVIKQGVLPSKAEFVVTHLFEFIELQIVAYNTHVQPIIKLFR